MDVEGSMAQCDVWSRRVAIEKTLIIANKDSEHSL